MVILVTGAVGFIGSNLIDSLLINGQEVIGIDNFHTNYSVKIKERNLKNAFSNDNFKFFNLDIKNQFPREVQQSNIETVIHLAAQPGVRSSFDDPQAMKSDISGTINILEFVRKNEIKNYIFSSSSSIYGNSSTPFNETSSIPNPISPYAAMKLSCEVFNQMYYNQYGFNTYNLRLFTVYGPRQRPDMGIYKFVNSISKNHKIKMFGNGVSSRDYTYISDLIQAIQLIMNKMDGYRTINIGSGRSVILSDLIQMIGEKLDSEPFVEYYPEQQGDVSDTCADIALAREYGYTPSVSIEKGIELFVDWYKNENLNSS